MLEFCMMPPSSIEELLKESFKRNKNGKNGQPKIAAFIPAQPNNFTKDETFTSIEYFENRSGDNIDFFS